MSTTGFTITKIAVQGDAKPDAALEFRPGLNVVAGASNTGKSYAWHVIDFMLGADVLRKSPPLARGYSRALIELQARSGETLSLARALSGGGASLYDIPIDEIDEAAPVATLKARHDGKDPRSISGLLLQLTGLLDKRVRRNDHGAVESLSFRLLAHHALIEEVRIQTEESPVDLGDRLLQSPRRAAFGLLITGVDDADIIAQESAKDRRQRYELQMSVLQELLIDRESKLEALSVDVDQLADQLVRVGSAVDEATSLLAVRQSELDGAAAVRDDAWSAIEAVKSQRLFLNDQIRRLELLESHYASDKARLESALEAGEFFERLPNGECPVCGHSSDSVEETGTGDARLREFQQACAAELEKIAALARDLGITLSAMRTEDGELEQREVVLGATLERANSEVSGLLGRRVKDAGRQLSQLIALQARLTEAAFAANEVFDLRERFTVAEQQSKAKLTKVRFSPKVGTANTAEFCKVVEDTLRAWKFPFQGNVSWSDNNFDLVIGGEDRGSMGKGHRAVTHAAFTVGLMRYCRAKGLPHPGVIVLDTPLNPYKGPDRAEKEEMNLEVQQAFYEDLAAGSDGDQVIIFENTEPPEAVRPHMNYVHFSGNPARLPAGFFPVPSSTASA